jgi:putative transposase
MPAGLRRYYGKGHLHFITFSCYRRLPLLKTVRARDTFVKELGKVRNEMGFHLLGYVVMPEHVHLLMSEPPQGTPSTVLQKLKLRVARRLRKRRGRRAWGKCDCHLRRRENRCERSGRRGFTISMCTAKERRGKS